MAHPHPTPPLVPPLGGWQEEDGTSDLGTRRGWQRAHAQGWCSQEPVLCPLLWGLEPARLQGRGLLHVSLRSLCLGCQRSRTPCALRRPLARIPVLALHILLLRDLVALLRVITISKS